MSTSYSCSFPSPLSVLVWLEEAPARLSRSLTAARAAFRPSVALYGAAPLPVADIRTVIGEGAPTKALNVSLCAGVSGHGSKDLAWIAWHCVNTNGWDFPSVCEASNH